MSAAGTPRAASARGDGSARTVGPARPVALPAAAVALAGALVWAAGAAFQPERALGAWLVAFAWALSMALGALCLVMIAHAAGVRWFVAVRRPAETAAGVLPLFVLLVLPLLAGAGGLYPWVPPLDDLPHHLLELIEKKRAWLDLPFFVLRSVLYLLVWSALAVWLRRWSLAQDEGAGERGAGDVRDGGDAGLARRERAVRVSAVGLLVFGFTVHFAAVDWLMSLAPEWVSTVFGVYWFAGGMVAGLAVLVLLTRRLERAGRLDGVVAASHYHALGRLLLTFVAFWAYIAYSQGFLVWIADLPAEAGWYLDRWEHGWSAVLWTLILGHFALPFAALLSRPLKRSPRALSAVAAWLVAVHYADLYWLVIPSLDAGRQGLGAALAGAWLDLAAVAAVGGAAVAFGAWLASGRSAVPLGDPRLPEAVEYESP